MPAAHSPTPSPTILITCNSAGIAAAVRIVDGRGVPAERPHERADDSD